MPDIDDDSSPSRDGNIRAISRGLAVLQAVNRGGSVTMMDISRQSRVPYPTACRIVQTLMTDGMIEREPARKRYRATALVKTLSYGYQEEDNLVAVARPHIVALCKKVAWPISVTTRVGHMMMVRDSTHKMTSLTLNNYAPGYTLPLTECSTGKAYLAFCDPEERADILRGMRELQGPAERMAILTLHDEAFFRDVREKGFATQARNAYTANPGKTSSLAVPLFRKGHVCGSMALIFFSSAMTIRQAQDAFLDDLKRTAQAISAEL